MATRRVWWGDYRTTEYAAIDPEATIAVLPVAAIEQHGPHLPVSTDTSIMHGMLETVIARLPDDLDIRILPVQAVGKSNEHLHAPGTLTLPATTLIEAWTRARRVGRARRRAQARRRQLAWRQRGDHGHRHAASCACATGMLAVKTSWQRFGRPAGMYSELEDRHGIHGGDVETSLMLHFRPDLVDMGKAENFVSNVARAEKEFELLRPHRHACLRLDRQRPQPARRGRRRQHRHGRERPADGALSGRRLRQAAAGREESAACRLAVVETIS